MQIKESEVEVTAIRAQGAGGQHVNKVSSAIHLRFDVMASSLPESVKWRLLRLSDHRITREGVVVIKSQEHRSQDMNRLEAFARLLELVQSVAKAPKVRKPTKPTYASQLRRLDSKKKTSATKSNRGRVL
jgi:ribosome-associated protein